MFTIIVLVSNNFIVFNITSILRHLEALCSILSYNALEYFYDFLLKESSLPYLYKS